VSRKAFVHVFRRGHSSAPRIDVDEITRLGCNKRYASHLGAAPALKDVISGDVPVMMLDVATAREPVKAALLKVLASASPQRLPDFPNVPTIAESGYPGFEASAWQGIVAPAKTPRDVVEKLNSQIEAALADPAVQEKLRAASIEPMKSTPGDFAAYIQSETQKWRDVIKAANISLN
jgi:tripartite-type tricarboxylate transporter receptor subunit TctC